MWCCPDALQGPIVKRIQCNFTRFVFGVEMCFVCCFCRASRLNASHYAAHQLLRSTGEKGNKKTWAFFLFSTILPKTSQHKAVWSTFVHFSVGEKCEKRSRGKSSSDFFSVINFFYLECSFGPWRGAHDEWACVFEEFNLLTFLQ